MAALARTTLEIAPIAIAQQECKKSRSNRRVAAPGFKVCTPEPGSANYIF